MLDARRHRLLAAMGITPWRLRDPAEPVTEEAPPEELQRLHLPLAGDHAGQMLEVVGDGLDEPEVAKLLAAMLAAIDLDLATARPAAGSSAAPRAILAFGDKAACDLTGSQAGVAALRGGWQQRQSDDTALIVTHHPARLLAQKSLKAEAWADLQRLQAALRESA